MTRFLPLLLLAGALGCAHAQLPPTNHTVSLTWSAPAGCTSAAPCTYVISRATVVAGTTACPAPNLTTPNYTPLNQSAPATGLSYVDPTASGTTACYIAQTLQGSAISAPSNTTDPAVVPANPNAPSLGQPSVASLAPVTPTSVYARYVVAELKPLNLRAR